jgi:hypothetical protein
MHQDLDQNQSPQHHHLLLFHNDTLDQDKKDVEPVPHARTVSSKNPLLRLLVSDENVVCLVPGCVFTALTAARIMHL